MVLESYDLGEELGEGSFGLVKAARCRRSGRLCVVKAVDRTAVPNIKALYSEVDLQSELDHPHICRVFETFTDAAFLYIVLERCYGGELFSYAVKGESDARCIFDQIGRALHYMHSRGIAHRDLKQENFLVRDAGEAAKCHVKLIDFGFATRFVEGAARMTTVCGSLPYMAPEVLQETLYTEKCDVFSMGVILFTMLTDRLPFDGCSTAQVTQRILREPLRFTDEERRCISREARTLTEWACTKAPEHRPSVGELLQGSWLRTEPADVDEQLLQDLAARSAENSSRSAFVQVAMRLAVHYSEDSNLGSLPELFTLLDENGDGQLSQEEASKLQCSSQRAPGARRCEALPADAALLPDDGCIKYNDFCATFMDPATCISGEACRAAFNALEDNGCVSPTKLRQVLESCQGPRWMREHQREVKAICRELGGSRMDLGSFMQALGLPHGTAAARGGA